MQQNQFSNPILKENTKDTIFLVKDSLSVNTDTILKLSNDTLLAEPVITSTHLEDNTNELISPIVKGYEKTPWFIGVLLLVLILFSKIKLSFPKLTPTVFQSLIKTMEVSKLYKSRNARHKTCYFFMNSLSLLVSSIFVFELSVYYGFAQESSFLHLIYIMCGVFSIALIKILLANIVGFIFRSSSEAAEYSFNLLLVWKSVGMMLIPLIIIIPFITYSSVYIFNIIGIGIVIMAYFLVIARALKILFTKHVSFLYLILYLCALEMVPLIAAYKYLTVN
jgi:hypothetical protein